MMASSLEAESQLSPAEPRVLLHLEFLKKTTPFQDPLSLIRAGCEFLFEEFPDNPVAAIASIPKLQKVFSVIQGVPCSHQNDTDCKSVIQALTEASEIPENLHWVNHSSSDANFPMELCVGLERTPIDDAGIDFLTLLFEVFCWSARFSAELWQQKLESLAEYAAGAGHEVNNPLGTITGRAALLLKEETDPERRRSLELIGAQSYRIRDMIGDSMIFGRPPTPVFRQLDLTDTLNGVIRRFQGELERKQVELKFLHDPEAQIQIEADESQLSTIAAELIRNSLAACESGGQICVEIELRNHGDHSGVKLSVRDSGVGLTEEQKQHCFDPFFSGRQAGRGLGFGLSKCWSFTQLHHGTIHHIDEAQETTFVVWLPIKQS